MKNDEVMRLLAAGFAGLEEAFAKQLVPDASGIDAVADTNETYEPAAQKVLAEVAERMGDNYPYFHPLYAGQMLKPPHPIARAAYAMAMAVNPNNHALDGGRASSRMEIEAVAAIAEMFGLGRPFLGHLTSSGTFANLEALWVAGKLKPAAAILASEQAHYTHSRISSVLKLPFETVTTDQAGRLDTAALEERLQQSEVGERRPVGTVVVTLGTTATGSVDPLADVLKLKERYAFRIHVDAAYGGYFKLCSTLSAAARSHFVAIPEADSVVIDPHKHGLQPYGCGCVLFRDANVGRFYKHDSPYTYFSSAELHLGEISLECSRAGAAAVALWATQRLLPMTPGGTFAADLERCRAAAMELHAHLAAAPGRWVTAFVPELDIVIWAVRTGSLEESSARAQEIFNRAAEQGLHLALAQLPARFFPSETWPNLEEGATVRCLRSVLMKPEHLGAMPRIAALLEGTGD